MWAPRTTIMETKSLPEIAYENTEFLNSTEARTIRILSEYLEPLARLNRLKVNSTILFLGSSRANPEERTSVLGRYYWEAEELAFRLARWAIPLKPKGKNFVICTGAGPGIMEAANRGAARAGAKSIGMNISLPVEQLANPYVSPELGFVFHYFFMRKFWLVSRARAIVAFPGGYGSLDEFFETITLIQTGKIAKKDIILLLYGEDYWRNILNFEAMIASGAISPGDATLFQFSSDPGTAFAMLTRKLNQYLKPGISPHGLDSSR
jgi:uncharacterized protein (TIGR00730 family)